MSDYRALVHRDPIQRDPVYAALGDPLGKDYAPEDYGSGPFWGWIVGFILTAAVLLIAYNGSEMRFAQHEVFPLPTRITPAPSPALQPLVRAPTNPGSLPHSLAR